MSESLPARLAPKRLRRLALALGAAILLLVTGLLIAYATRERWLGPLLAEQIALRLSRATGAEVRIGALGGDWLETIELKQVSWLDPRPGAALPELELALARAHWHPWSLLRGRDGWLERVEVEGLFVRARAGGRGAEGGRDTGGEGGGGGPRIPAGLPSARIEGRDVELELPAGLVALRSVRLEVDPLEEGRQRARCSAALAAWQPRSGPARSAPLEAILAWSAPRLAVDSLRLAGVERVRGAWLDLGEVHSGALAWSARLTAFDGELGADGAWCDGALDLDVELETVQLGRAFEEIAPELAARPEGVVTGSVSLHLDKDRPRAFSASFDAHATALRWSGRDVDELEAAGSVGGGTLSLTRVQALRGTGSLSAKNVVVPLGRSLDETVRGARGELELRATDLPAWLGAPAPPGSLTARVPPHLLEIGARWTEAGLELERGQLATTGGALAVRPSSIAWGPQGRWLEEARLDVDLGLEFSDLAPLGAVLAMRGAWSGSLRGALAIDGTRDTLAGELDLEGQAVTAAGFELGDLRAHVNADEERIQVHELRAAGPLGELELAGAWSPRDGHFADARLRARIAAPQAILPSVLALGTLEVEAEGQGTLLEPSGRVQVRARGVELLALGGHTVESLDLAARLEPGRVLVEELALEAEGAQLRTAGTFGHARWRAPYVVELDALAARQGTLELALAGPARVELDGDTFDTGPLRLEGTAGELEVDLSGAGGDLALRVRASQLRPMPLLAPLAPRGFHADGIEGSAALDLAGGELRAEAALTVGSLVPAEGVPELSFSAHGTLQDRRAVLERFAFARAGVGSLSLTGEAPFDPLGRERFGPGPLALRGRLELEDLAGLPFEPPRDLEFAGRIGVGFDLTGEWERARGELEIEGSELALVSRSGTALFGPAGLSAQVHASEGALRLSSVELRSPAQLDLSGEGSLGLDLAPSAWIEGGRVALGSAPIDLALRLSAADLAFLARLMPGMRRVAGRVDGDLALKGTLARPEPSGTLRLRDGALRLAGNVPPFESVHAELVLEGEVLRLPILSAEMGGAPLSASGSLDWSGSEPLLQLDLTGEEVLIVQQTSLRLRADANLHVSGPFSALQVSGALALRDGVYTKRFDLFRRDSGTRVAPGPPIQLFSFEAGPLATMRLDVDITSREPFRVENNLVQGALRADLKLGGTGRSPELIGALFVDPTLVQLPATTLETTSGTLVFGRADPLMPVLDVRLETRVRGYDVALHATGSLDDPELELNSIPPLPSEDLLVLVLTGKPPDLTWNADTGEQAAQTVAFYVGMDLLSDWFGSEGSGEASWLDRIEWRTGVDMTASGEETSELMVRVAGAGRGAAGRTVWLRAENDAYDRVNYGIRFLFRLK